MNALFRLPMTVAVPVLAVWAGGHVLLPGVSAELARRTGHPATLGLFALGVVPMISAYLIVEIAAYLVRPWSSLRHDPSGRVKLERAVRIVTVTLPAFQSFGVATLLQGLELDSAFGTQIAASRPVVMASLVGGVCVLVAAIELVSRSPSCSTESSRALRSFGRPSPADA